MSSGSLIASAPGSHDQHINPPILPSPTSATLSTLDHSAYPHIFEGVLSYATPETLLVVERTGRGVRELVHPHLYRHIALEASAHGRGAVVRLPCEPYRVLSSWNDFPKRDERDDGDWGDEPLRAALAMTQCIDLGAPVRWQTAHFPAPALQILRTSLASVAYFPPWPPSPPRAVLAPKGYRAFSDWERVRARVFVTHMDLHTSPAQPSWLYDLEYSDEEEGSQFYASRPSTVLQVRMPPETRRLVLHLHWAGALRPGIDIQISPQGLEEHADVVVVLHPPAAENTADESAVDEGWFATLLQHLVKVAVQRRARIAIVGVEACSEPDLGMRQRPSYVPKWQRKPHKPQSPRRGEDLVAAVARLLNGTCERAWCDVTGEQMEACRAMWALGASDVEGLSGQIRLLSAEEWARTADPRESAPMPMASRVGAASRME
ncbi:hypothetical protein CC85DRAFT_285309 [Cutaneotrichosporon oleaginosum]|uniref:Uncharacterized protein n=1 Tax=Cutaneotrichosporon oleaginosum TaxID=879819 RepID=A0A0J0XNY1_9TREE|nr:uncharacterized protein CC85DRAFT_285309 [Cutaneotrichosporon oleaginosum]KLT42772.1 hypothetical protein CC85DRAFT_285309 [Cutaneotrichosporon oleaginosum]TXT09510.1 hypothetical protein COLE_03444 [Cutaneotrichosporon oleaginosum]